MTGTLYCAACIHEPERKFAAPGVGDAVRIREAVTTIVGTALCLEHARHWLYVAVRVEGVKP